MRIFIIVALLLCCANGFGQDSSMLSGLNETPRSNKVEAIFKSPRIINTHSVEMLGKGSMDFRILHRFGPVNQGISQFFGLDEATMRIGLDYGLNDNLTVGVGRSTFHKELDGFVKLRLLQQTSGAANIPFSLVCVGGMMVRTEKNFDTAKLTLSDRTASYGQLLIARKMNQRLSIQVSATVLHMNYVPFADLRNTIFAAGIGLRYKLTHRFAFVADWQHPFGGLPIGTKDPLAIGFDIETGGHIFQLHFSNATGMNERALLGETTGSFFKGDIRFGFNLSRVFQLVHPKKDW